MEAEAAPVIAEVGKDLDLELALQLHRELNAPQRLTRRGCDPEDRNRASNKPGRSRGADKASPASSAPGASGDRSRRGSRASSDDERPARARKRRRPYHVRAAAEALKGAIAGDEAAPQGHVKCFVAGVATASIVPADSLGSWEALEAAVQTAFATEGAGGDSALLSVVMVSNDGSVHSYEDAAAAAAGQMAEVAGAVARIFVVIDRQKGGGAPAAMMEVAATEPAAIEEEVAAATEAVTRAEAAEAVDMEVETKVEAEAAAEVEVAPAEIVVAEADVAAGAEAAEVLPADAAAFKAEARETTALTNPAPEATAASETVLNAAEPNKVSGEGGETDGDVDVV